MATMIESGSAVKSGYYFNPARWHVTPVEKDGGRLPEGAGRWMKVNTAVALVLVPILGATFLMFLPLIGFVLFLRAMATAAVRTFSGSAEELAATVSPGWAAGEAHLTGKSGEEAGGAAERASPGIEKLAKEIEEARKAARDEE